nr:MAG TPA: Thiol:disulfide interchange protein DsbA EcDsbA, Sulfonamide, OXIDOREDUCTASES [Caudoviricetes sp.]
MFLFCPYCYDISLHIKASPTIRRRGKGNILFLKI